jgi:ABC-type glycerol-3-phosphate transport system permease component
MLPTPSQYISAGQGHERGSATARPRSSAPQGQFFTDYNLLAAGSVLVALPTILVFLLLQRHFIAGLTLGSTKG